MTEPITVVQTAYHRKLTVTPYSSGTHLNVEEQDHRKATIGTSLDHKEAKELGTALLAAAGEPVNDIGELPAVKEDPFDSNYFEAGGYARRITADPAEVLRIAKSYFAIAKELQKRADDKAAADKAAAAAEADFKLATRRDELVRELTGSSLRTYDGSSTILRTAVDKIIELEGKVSKPKAVWASVPF